MRHGLPLPPLMVVFCGRSVESSGGCGSDDGSAEVTGLRLEAEQCCIGHLSGPRGIAGFEARVGTVGVEPRPVNRFAVLVRLKPSQSGGEALFDVGSAAADDLTGIVLVL